MELGYALMCEEHPPEALLDHAQRAHQAGFELLSVSDHFHPWLDQQGHSPFAWSVLAALTERVELPLISLVTCPLKRYHPAIVAQMAATTARLNPPGFILGLGAGENLNEHVVGGEWPDPATRLQQLEEAVAIIEDLLAGHDVNHRGWFTVDRAQLYTRPDSPPPIALAAGGHTAARLAGRLGTGLVAVGPHPDLVEAYHQAGGQGPVIAQATVCWHENSETARKTMQQHWPQASLGWAANADLLTPAGFAAATRTVRAEDVADAKPLGNHLDDYLESLAHFADAGVEQLLLHNVGAQQTGFLDWAAEQLLPQWRRQRAAGD